MKDHQVDGVLLVDKPAGLSSHAVVDRARKSIGTRRIGHGGTLDPFATGLLVLLINRATRLLPFLDGEPKLYRARVRFGAATTTDDAEGDLVAEAPVPGQPEVDRALSSLTGHLLQRPPAFSAKQVAGERAYVAARRGAPIALQPVGVTVYEWRVLAREGSDLDVEVRCSGGTYVRALARDLGEATGSAAHLTALRRLRSGSFDVADAVSIDALDRGDVRVLPPTAAVGQLPTQTLDDLDARRVSHGQPVAVAAASAPRGDVVALLHENELLAVAARDGTSWRPKVVLSDD